MAEFKEKFPLDFLELQADFEGFTVSLSPILPPCEKCGTAALKHSVSPRDVRHRRVRVPLSFLTHLQQVTGHNIDFFISRYCAHVRDGAAPETLPPLPPKAKEEKEPGEAKDKDQDEEWIQVFVGSEEGAIRPATTAGGSPAAPAPASGAASMGGATALDPIQYSRGQLKLSQGVAMSLFTPVVSKITAHLREVLAKVGPCSHIFVAGGFAESEVLKEAVEAEVKKTATMIRPPHASLAVLTGAVLYGLNRRIVSSRVVKRTYGIYVAEKWKESKHGKAKRKKEFFLQDGKPTAFTLGAFHKFVEEGQEVKVDEKVVAVFNPIGIFRPWCLCMSQSVCVCVRGRGSTKGNRHSVRECVCVQSVY